MKYEEGYPYIGKGLKNEMVALFFNPDESVILNDGDGVILSRRGITFYLDESLFENKTKEYLTNTYGKAESEEHREMIIQLAENAGLKIESHSSNHWFGFTKDYCVFTREGIASAYNETLITLPTPPVHNDDSWPQVGDEVDTKYGKALLVADKDCHGMYVVTRNGEHIICDSDYLVKPKAEKELLRDEIKFLNLSCNADVLVDRLLDKYNITGKDKPIPDLKIGDTVAHEEICGEFRIIAICEGQAWVKELGVEGEYNHVFEASELLVY